MKKITLIAIVSVILAFTASVQAQCTWQSILTDGYEYQTIVPDLIPGTTVHNTPQSFAVHSGTYSLYMNFINCVGTTGTCAGDMVYQRGFSVCRNQPIRFTSWLTTSFAGTQCNMHILVKDGNGTILNDQLNVSAPYAPVWYQYQSGPVTPVTDSIVFVMYTNVGGGGGNDLSMDDFTMEKCTGGGNSTSPASVCSSASATNLFGMLPGNNITTGTWSGPSTLTGGYLGTFNPTTNATGTYVYTNPWFGTLPGCPLAYDSLIVQLAPSPVVNLGSDTTLCTNQNMLLSAGSTPGNTYLWQNGVTGPNQLAFTISTVDTSYTYWVLVTAPGGCTGTDTVTVNFVVCSGTNELDAADGISIFPVPAVNDVTIRFNEAPNGHVMYALFAPDGSRVLTGMTSGQEEQLRLPKLAAGVYTFMFSMPGREPSSRQLIIRE